MARHESPSTARLGRCELLSADSNPWPAQARATAVGALHCGAYRLELAAYRGRRRARIQSTTEPEARKPGRMPTASTPTGSTCSVALHGSRAAGSAPRAIAAATARLSSEVILPNNVDRLLLLACLSGSASSPSLRFPKGISLLSSHMPK